MLLKKQNSLIYLIITLPFFIKQYSDMVKGGTTYDIFEQWMGAGYIFSKLQAYINFDLNNIIFSKSLGIYDYFGYVFMLPAYIFERIINGFMYDENNIPINNASLFFASEDAQTYFSLHFFLLVYSFLCMYIIYRKLTQLIDKNFSVLFLLIIFLIPSFSGHMLFNVKDIPFLLNLFIATLYILEIFCYKNLSEIYFKDILKASLVFAFSLLTRVNSIFFISFLFLYIFLRKIKLYRVVLKKIISVYVLALTFLLIGSPSAWRNPIKWIFESIEFQSNHYWSGNTLTNGKFVFAQEMSGTYLFEWYFYRMPLFLHLSLIFFIYFLIIQKNNSEIENYSFIFILANFLLFPIIKPTAYDGLRHFLFLIPFFTVLCVSVLQKIKIFNGTLYNFVFSLIIIYGLFTQWGLDSYRYTYFNELTDTENISISCENNDGCGNWPTDYWGFSGKELADIFNSNYKETNLLVCEPKHGFSSYLDNYEFNLIGLDQIVYYENFYTLTLHRPRQDVNSCDFHFLNYKIECKLADSVTRQLRGEEIFMSYVHKCSAI